MKLYDCHIHSYPGPCDPPEVFLEKAATCGVIGGTIFSESPASHHAFGGADQRAEARIDKILAYTSKTPGFLPYFFLDPTEKDAIHQVEYAKKAGIRGLKIIIGAYHISDHLDPIRAAAEAGLPVMFHSGICGDAHPTSFFNRPIEFECLFAIGGLKFSLAHMAWPWYDEFIGIYGKFCLARDGLPPEKGRAIAEMYIDLTPGTPGIYRREALRHLYLTGYKVTDRAMWGCDLNINDYEVKYGKLHLKRDLGILREIENDYFTDAVDHDWLPDLTDIRTPVFGPVWSDFAGEPIETGA